MRRPQRVFNYFGSKVAAAKHYPAPKHDKIIEPFAGGAGYSLFHREKQVHLVDLNPDVIDAWLWLIKASAEEVRKLPLLTPGEAIPASLTRGQKLVLGWATSLVSASPQRILVPSSAKVPNSFWGENRREALASLVDQIRHWTAKCCSYEEIKNEKATWFIDPPYFGDVGQLYPFSDVNYEKLAEFCSSRKGQVIVCEGPEAVWLPFRPSHETPGALSPSTGRRDRSTERIWTSG